MYRLLIVDDEPAIVDGLAQMFGESELDLDIWKATSAIRAVEMIQQMKVDIVLSDIRMPEKNGLQLIDEVLFYWPTCKIIFLTGYSEFEYAYAAIQKNVEHYILKHEDDSTLIAAVQAVIHKLDAEKRNQDLIEMALKSINENQPDDLNKTNGSQDLISKIHRYIDENLGGDLSLIRMADFVYMNPSYFSRYYKQHTGCNISEYIQASRLRAAKAMLTDSRMKVQDIANRLGFTSPSYFAIFFKKMTGMTPQDYKEKL